MWSSRLVATVAPQVRQMSVISGPPSRQVSTVEKIAGALSITIGMFAIPSWVLVNLKHYKNRG